MRLNSFDQHFLSSFLHWLWTINRHCEYCDFRAT